jgi:hypothetical protein
MLSASESKSRTDSTSQVAHGEWRKNILQAIVSAIGVFVAFVTSRFLSQANDQPQRMFARLSGISSWQLVAALLLIAGFCFVIYMIQYVFNKKYNPVTKILFSAAGFILLYELSILADAAFP